MAFLDVQAGEMAINRVVRVVSERVELGMAKKMGGNEKDEGVLEVVQSLLVTDEEETNSVFNVQKLYINLHYNQNNHHNKQK